MTEQTDATNAVVIERTFNAPLALVWSMWTDAGNAFASWYGPTGGVDPIR